MRVLASGSEVADPIKVKAMKITWFN